MTIRTRRKWLCQNCKKEYYKWNGTCYAGCKKAATLEEVKPSIPDKRYRQSAGKNRQTTKPARVSAEPSPADISREVRRVQRRAKTSERDIARRMVQVDGPDPVYKNIASSTGRIGHITGIRVDAISRSYVTENKNRKMPSWLVQAWVLIQQRSVDFGKNALLHVDPPNMPRTYPIQGVQRKTETMSIITTSRHDELIINEKILSKLMEYVDSQPAHKALQDLFQTLQSDFTTTRQE